MAVLVVGYQRAEEISKVIFSLSKFKPKKLYLAMDGPKNNQKKNLCEEARSRALNAVNWDCELITLFSELNHGPGKFMLLAIDWFFKKENQGLILEDDILIHDQFYEFAKRFSSIKDLACVSACTFDNYLLNKEQEIKCFYSLIPSIWGWYTTKKIWHQFRHFKRKRESPIKYFFNLKKYIGFWQSFVFSMCLDYIDQGKLVGWDYEFAYFQIISRKISIYPSFCMAENIGNSPLAMHCESKDPISQTITNKRIQNKKSILNPKLNKNYMSKQSLNTMMKEEYKIHAFKGLIKYFLKKIFKIGGR